MQQSNNGSQKEHQIRTATLEKVARSEVFDELNKYDGQLGAFFTKEKTGLRLWAPTAAKVEVVLYENPTPDSQPVETVAMDRGEPGTWEVQLSGNQNGTVYTYRLTFPDGTINETVDPYAKAVTANGERTVILSPEAMTPESWGERMEPFTQPQDAVIYEMHVRDFTVSSASGAANQGQFLGIIEPGTETSTGHLTGLDYLKSLGVTHIQLLPMFDYAIIDETNPDTEQYNWGYDPVNYNVPEGSYATDAMNPATRIIEMKQMIKGLHDSGFRVIMDVVYNHVYNAEEHSFHKTVPGYFFRYTQDGQMSNGSGCGNDVASERVMVRKYIVDSVTYWAQEYQIDGFRFDLMGLHDIQTMNAIRKAVDNIDPSILILGEGWDLDTALPDEQKANQKNAEHMPGIAHFNDSLRDSVRGSALIEQDAGFVNGKKNTGKLLAQNIFATLGIDPELGSYTAPVQVVQYAEAHDNLTMYDKLVKTNPKDTEAVRRKRHQLATSIVLLSQGIPFLHAGQEFFRTKGCDENSYRSPDSVNQLDWNRAEEFSESVEYVRGLIRLRKAHPLFRLGTFEEIEEHMQLLKAEDGVIAYEVKDTDRQFTVVFNANEQPASFKLHKGEYNVLVKDGTVDIDAPISFTSNGRIEIPRISAMVLERIGGDSAEETRQETILSKNTPLEETETGRTESRLSQKTKNHNAADKGSNFSIWGLTAVSVAAALLLRKRKGSKH